MHPEIISQSPHACCCICYSPNVEKICHHCGKAICKDHDSEFVFWNYEFTGLFLPKKSIGTRKNVVHCSSCASEIHAKWLFMYHLGGIVPLDRGYAKYLKDDDCLLLPIVPSISSVTIDEEIAGHVTLDSKGIYFEEITLFPRGSLEITTKFNEQDRAKLKAYRRKYRIAESENLLLHAGFVVMQKTTNLSFDSTAKQNLLQIDTFILRGNVAEQPFLSQNSDKKLDDIWRLPFPYKIFRGDEKEIPLPIQLVPILVRDDAVALVIQSRPCIADLVQVKSARIDELNVSVSPHLSKVIFTHPPARIYDLGIIWVKPDLESYQQVKLTNESVDEEPDAKWSESRSHYMRFENKIHLLEEGTRFTGKLTMILEGTLSGIETPLFFFPWGQKQEEEEAVKKSKHQTKVEVSFDLDLSSLRCPKRYPEQAETELPATEYPGAMLDHYMVTRLTRRLNEVGAYVKSVIENPARTDKTNANVTNHFWDIAGRYYEGIFPVNFHLVLTGKQDRTWSNACSVITELYVHGLVTDEEMQKRIDRVREDLQAVIDETFEEQVHPPARLYRSNGRAVNTEKSAIKLVKQMSALLSQLGNILRDDSLS